MRIPFVSRSAYERAMSEHDTDAWALKREILQLREREKARMICCDMLSTDAEESRRERDRLEEEVEGLRERAQLLAEDNRELRKRYDTARAEIARMQRENKSLRLMQGALEAQLGAGKENMEEKK